MILRSLRILITGDLMLRTFFTALVSFALPLSFGALFRFVPLESFWLIPLFLPCTALLRLFYRKASCRSLEIRDFALALIFAALCALMLHLMGISADLHVFCYLYLCSFTGIVQLACCIRFKTLLR